MPVTVVVGGQFGSEGKGKVALEITRNCPDIRYVVRPGGSNSGHTGYSASGKRHVLRQLPAAAIDNNVTAVLPAGSYIDPHLLLSEVREIGLDHNKVKIDPRAHIITEEHKAWERDSALIEGIGSTASGTGAAFISRSARYSNKFIKGTTAKECDELSEFLAETSELMMDAHHQGQRILIEGTQGSGLSCLHGDSWPKATARDTTAAGFLSETGLSPMICDEIAMVIRTFPIRVSGDSGPLVNETSWQSIASNSGGPWEAGERTSVTQKIRRVGFFDAEIVKRAILINHPTSIYLNHIDHVDFNCHNRSKITEMAHKFIAKVQSDIEARIDFIGTGQNKVVPTQTSSLVSQK